MADKYYGVEPYSGKIIQHFGIPGMKWGWTKDGKKTGAKEAMTEQERAQRRKDLIKKIGAGVGTAAAIGGTVLAIKNRKKIGIAARNAKKYFTKKNIFGKTKFNKDISKVGSSLSSLGSSVKSNATRFGTAAGSRLSTLKNKAQANAMRGLYTAKSFKKGGLSGAKEFWKKSSKYMKR